MVYQGKAHPYQSEASLLVEQSLILEQHTCPESGYTIQKRRQIIQILPVQKTHYRENIQLVFKETHDGVVEDVPYVEARFSLEEEESY